MLCANCHAEVKPVAAIDIDGTLGNYHDHFFHFAEAWLGWPASTITNAYGGDEPYRQWFCNVFGVDATTFRAIKLAYRQGGMKRTMPAYQYASDLTGMLRDSGIEVWLTTTRPWQRYDRIDPDTHEWLRRNDVGFDAVLYDEDKYQTLADRVGAERVIGVLDDEPEQIDRALQLFPYAFLRTTYYNRKVQRRVMVDGLLEAARLFQEHANRWRAKHGQGH